MFRHLAIAQDMYAECIQSYRFHPDILAYQLESILKYLKATGCIREYHESYIGILASSRVYVGFTINGHLVPSHTFFAALALDYTSFDELLKVYRK